MQGECVPLHCTALHCSARLLLLPSQICAANARATRPPLAARTVAAIAIAPMHSYESPLVDATDEETDADDGADALRCAALLTDSLS